jgi:hydroxymethylpyrimidine/phosphomethylpyrimidine kinase
VVDPVMVASSGDPLLQPDAIAAYEERLFPLAELITPNLDEVRTLIGRPVGSMAELRRAGAELVERHGVAFLLKGGHLREEVATDLLLLPDGSEHSFSSKFVPGVSTHGTGCTYAAAITSGLARGLSLPDAVRDGKLYVSRAIESYLRWERNGATTDALHHHFART